MQFQRFFRELKRRNVFRIATAYAIGGWLIIQICTSTFPYLNLPDWLITAVIVFVGIGLPIALIFAWAFELTPEGIKKSKEVDITASVTDRTGKKLNGIIITVLSMAVIFLLVERVFFATSGMIEVDSTEFTQASIAVLPFADLSPDGNQEYFSDGLSEELLNVLAKVENLKVAGRTSSFKFKGQNEDLKLIGEQLGVNHILEGSVRKSGDQIRITAQLISVNDGFHMWSETYDRTYNASNLFQIQDEISNQVLKELKLQLLGIDLEENIETEIPTQDIEAYEAYLKGNELIVNRKPEEIEQAIEEYKRALKIDPSFGWAYARLSIAYNLLYEYGNIDKEEVADLIRRNADQAIFIDPSIPQAYAGLSRYYSIKEDFENEVKAINKANELNPNDPEILNWYGVSIQLDDREKADSLYLEAYEIDPLSPVITSNVSSVYSRRGDYDKALQLLDKNIELNPEYGMSYVRIITLLRNEPQGKLDEAFIAAYKGYQERKEDLEFINLMITSAYQFDLDSLASIYEKEIIRLFPNNPRVENFGEMAKYDSLDIYYESKEYDKMLRYVERELPEMMEEQDFGKQIVSMKYFDFFENKEYEKAVNILEEHYPFYFTDTLTVHPESYSASINGAYLFRKTGRINEAEQLERLLLELPFEYPDFAKPEFDEDIKKENTRTLFQMATKYAYLNDPKKVAEIVNEIYFVRNAKNYGWEGRWEEEWYDGLRDHPELAAVLKRIEEDKKRMKDNVISFLKEEGVWNEVWAVEEN